MRLWLESPMLRLSTPRSLAVAVFPLCGSFVAAAATISKVRCGAVHGAAQSCRALCT